MYIEGGVACKGRGGRGGDVERMAQSATESHGFLGCIHGAASDDDVLNAVETEKERCKMSLLVITDATLLQIGNTALWREFPE